MNASDSNPRTESTPGGPDRRRLLQDALATIERLQARIASVEAAAHEPIAIVGIGLRAPGGVVDTEGYWRLLAEGRDAVGEVPPDRWDVDAFYDPDPSKLGKSRTKAGGFLDSIDEFEPSFFGMSPREAKHVDPQHRLLLETAWEALEASGIPADRLDGSPTGVFVGITSHDYDQRIDVDDPDRSDIYLATGTALNVAAGRISFSLGLRGPCMAIDTACSSSLVAIHAACQSLRAGECTLALAGGVNLILAPEPYVLISKWGMLSPEGRCKTFDASADGFVRAEGCAMIALERLSDAVAAGRKVLAVIRGSAINQDGRSSGLTVPNGLAQQEVARLALQSARVAPNEVSYVEAHGTGTSLGDPIEVEALAAVYGEGRPADAPLEVGSVKSNIGHLEAASGVMSLIKLTLAMQHGELPASLHVRQPTPSIPWERIPVRVSTTLHPWRPRGRRIAGVSAFGFSGMNAHAIVEEAPPEATKSEPTRGRLQVLALSARTAPALESLARRHATHLVEHPELALADVCASAATGRAQFGQRLAIVAADREEAVAALRAAAEDARAGIRGASASGARLRVAFMFTGQGSQYAGMGRELFETEAAFRDAFVRCEAVLDPILGTSLRSLVFDGVGDLSATGNTQPALYALQVSLAAMWRHWGVEPTSVIGHSVGEFAAAAVAGVFSIEDGARLIAERGRLMQRLPSGGTMIAVQGDPRALEAAAAKETAAHDREVSVAARNAPGSLVLSGSEPAIGGIAERLALAGFKVQRLVVSHAFHSPLMEPMVDAFGAFAASVRHEPPKVPWISTVDGAPLDLARWRTRMADYWATHVRACVAFADGAAALLRTGCEAVIEIGPHPVLIGSARLCTDGSGSNEPLWLPSLRRGVDGRKVALEGLGHYWAAGGVVDWRAFHGPHRPVPLPFYPFQRQRYLVDWQPRSHRAVAHAHALLGARLQVAGVDGQFEREFEPGSPAWVADHRVAGMPVLPMTAYLELVRAAGEQVLGSPRLDVESLEVIDALALPQGERRVVQTVVDSPEGATVRRVRVFSRDPRDPGAPWRLHATAGVRPVVDGDDEPLARTDRDLSGAEAVALDGLYGAFATAGVEFGAAFRRVGAIRRRADGVAVADLDVPAEFQPAAGVAMHPAVLDACTHAAGAITVHLLADRPDVLYLPVAVDRYRLSSTPPTGALRSIARLREGSADAPELVMDVTVERDDGVPIAFVQGIRSRRVERSAIRGAGVASVSGWMHEVAWREAPLAVRTTTTDGVWIVLDDATSTLADRVGGELAAAGARVLRVEPGDAFAVSGDRFAVPPTSPDAHRSLLEAALRAGPIRGIVSLWPLRVQPLSDATVPGEVQRFGTEAALALLKALADVPDAATSRAWFVTRASQWVDAGEALRLEQAPLGGLLRVAANELGSLAVTHVDLDGGASIGESASLVSELLAGDPEREVAFRKGTRRVPRLAACRRSNPADVDADPVRLEIQERGTLEKLRHVPDRRREPGPGEVEIRVRASGLNFRDVLYALGMYPGQIERLGSDCAGEVVRVGEGVSRFRPGDRVVAMTSGAFASHTVTREAFVAPLPDSLDFERGAGIPTAYLTAWITLVEIAKVGRGHRVLVHSGAGGVGMAAIALCVRAGAEVFATAGSPEKRALLVRLGVAHALDSRSPSFADEILRITDGRGVDVVLNSLAGEMMDRSFEVLAAGGVFLEIGKRGLWSDERVAALGKGIRYHVVDCNDNARETPELVGSIFRTVLEDIASGSLPELPSTTFPFESAREAFRYMAQARHVGRVVFRHPATIADDVRIDAARAYLVTGGLGGLGIAAGEWLLRHGARRIVLAGRSAPAPATARRIEEWRAQGAVVEVVPADVSTDDGVVAALDAVARISSEIQPLGGVLHCAGRLDDGALANMDPDRLATSMGPKADAAWRIDRDLRRRGWSGDFVVLYASLSAVLGAPGQANYAAANAFLDALALARRAEGRPFTSVDWGAWAEVGMAARSGVVGRAAAGGFGSIDPDGGMRVLESVIRERRARIVVSPIDRAKLAAGAAAGRAPLLSELVERPAGAAPGEAAPAQALEGLEPAALRPVLLSIVRRELGNVLGLGAAVDSIPEDETFSAVGLDSLTAVELRNRLQRVIGRPLPATAAMTWPSISAMGIALSGFFEASAAPGAEASADREVIEL